MTTTTTMTATAAAALNLVHCKSDTHSPPTIWPDSAAGWNTNERTSRRRRRRPRIWEGERPFFKTHRIVVALTAPATPRPGDSAARLAAIRLACHRLLIVDDDRIAPTKTTTETNRRNANANAAWPACRCC